MTLKVKKNINNNSKVAICLIYIFSCISFKPGVLIEHNRVAKIVNF